METKATSSRYKNAVSGETFKLQSALAALAINCQKLTSTFLAGDKTALKQSSAKTLSKNEPQSKKPSIPKLSCFLSAAAISYCKNISRQKRVKQFPELDCLTHIQSALTT